MGELTLEETSLFPENDNTPNVEQQSEPMTAVFERHAENRKTNPWYLDAPGMIAFFNIGLEPSGYRLEAVGPPENGVVKLLHKEQLVAGQLNLWTLEMDSVSGSHPDFALQVEDMERHALVLFRPGKEEVLDFERYAWAGLAFAGKRLVTVERDSDERGLRFQVKLDGERVYTFNSAFRKPLGIRIHGWGDHWVLEVDGTLVLEGQIVNLEYDYGEIFFWRLLDGRPFFFEKGGQVGISYDGQELPVKYAEVIHAQCCGAGINPAGSEQMVWFFARKDGWWYYVELGKFD